MNKTREEILSMNDIVEAVVDVPEWRTEVKIRQVPLSAAIDLGTTAVKLDEQIIRTVIAGTVTDDGGPLFTLDDIEALGKKNPAVLIRLSQRIAELSKPITDQVFEAAAKN
jgi:hypothetical protein